MYSEVLEKINNLNNLMNSSQDKYNNIIGSSKDTKYDKTQFDFSHEKACHDLHNMIYFRHHQGIYGSSNVSSIFNQEFTKYIAKAINEQKIQIFNRALELIKLEIKNQITELKIEKDEIEKTIHKLNNM